MFLSSELTKKGQAFEWTDSCDEAFGRLKQKLIESPVLRTLLVVMATCLSLTLMPVTPALVQFSHKFKMGKKR